MRYYVKYIISVWLFCAHLICFGEDLCTQHLPYGSPSSDKSNATLLCHSGYSTLNDNQAKIPIWVAYVMTPEEVLGCNKRTNNFSSDISLDTQFQSSAADYNKTGYDMGHMASAADMSWSEEAMHQSFFMTNIAPQLPELNRGAWRVLESNVRFWTLASNNSILIYVGPVYNNHDSKIGKGVVIPHGFYKIVVNMDSHESIAFLFPHKNVDIDTTITTIGQIESATNLHFPVPNNIDKHRKSNMWNVDKKYVQQIKQKTCSRSNI